MNIDLTSSSPNVAASVARKVNRRILPLLMAGWFIAYIDRFNVGFAALQMNEALGLTAATFGLGAGLFFLGYSLFEIPSNLALARIGPRVWLARIMISWGIVSVAMMATQGAWSFYGLRVLLGVAEAGCFPGMAFYLTRWLSPRQRTTALASLATMSMVSGIAGAPLGAALLALDGTAGLAGWQWLFLIEGLPAIVLGACYYWFLPDTPDSVRWLTLEERQWLQSQNVNQEHAPTRTAMQSVLADSRYWLWGAAFFCMTAAGSALRLFQPTILQALTGLSDTMSALLTAVPSIVGVIAIVYVGRRSTRLNERRWHAAMPILVSAAALALIGAAQGVVWALVVSSVATIGVAAQPPLFAAVSTISSGKANAVGIAFVNSVAALGAFLGPYVVGYGLDSSRSLAFVCAVAGGVMALGGLIALTVRETAAPAVPLAERVAPA